MLSNPYQISKLNNKSDNLNLNQIIEEEGVHYNMSSLLKYPQTRAIIQFNQRTQNSDLPKLAVNSLTKKNNLKQTTKTNNSYSALKQHIEKLERKLSEYEPDLRFIHDLLLEESRNLSEE